MKGDDLKKKPSSVSASVLKPKPLSMNRSREAASKMEKKKTLVALRLSMLEEDNDAISSINHPKVEHLNPEPTTEPLALTKPSKLKRVRQSRELNSRSESPAMQRAEELQATLPAEHPILVKYMLHSHIASGFWLGLPKKFCNQHLPASDTTMVLIDEGGGWFQAKYLAAKVGLSGGWRGFSMAHNLEEGDVVVFQLVESTTFKVYIIRRDNLGKPEGVLRLPGSDACAEHMILSSDKKIVSGSPSSEELGSEVLDGVRLSESVPVSFKEVKTFENFSILLDGSVSIDAKFPDHLRRKYFDVCMSQNSFLHANLLKGLNCTLVVGILNETINIADAVRVCNSNTVAIPQSELLAWDKTLQSFELVGMNVAFLRDRISRILGKAIEATCMEAKGERELAGERMRILEVKFLELRKQMEEIDEEMEKMEEMTKGNQLKFHLAT